MLRHEDGLVRPGGCHHTHQTITVPHRLHTDVRSTEAALDCLARSSRDHLDLLGADLVSVVAAQFGEPLPCIPESQTLEDGLDFVPFPLLQPQRLQIDPARCLGYRHIWEHLHELAIQEHLFPMPLQVLSKLWRLVIEVGEYPLEASVFGDEPGGRLLPDAGDSGEVVG